MAIAFLAVTIAFSIIAFRFWTRLFARRLKPLREPRELADMTSAELPSLIAAILPRPLRGAWNALWLGLCVVLLGIPHHLVLWNFWRRSEPDPWLYAHYSWTLLYWLALLGLPALIITRHRQARAQRRSGTPPLGYSALAKRLGYVWMHGAALAIASLLGISIAFACVLALTIVVTMILMIAGQDIDGREVARVALFLFPIWLPIGMGWAARYGDRLKLRGYPEPTSAS